MDVNIGVKLTLGNLKAAAGQIGSTFQSEQSKVAQANEKGAQSFNTFESAAKKAGQTGSNSITSVAHSSVAATGSVNKLSNAAESARNGLNRIGDTKSSIGGAGDAASNAGKKLEQMGSSGSHAANTTASGMKGATSAIEGLSTAIGGVIAGYGALQIAQSAWTGAVQSEFNEALLARKFGAQATEINNNIKSIVAAVPGDDSFMNQLLTGAAYKSGIQNVDMLTQMGNAAADYMTVSQSMGKSQIETQMDLKEYFLTGNTTQLERDSILKTQLDKLEGQTTVEGRIKAMNEALNAEGYKGLSQLDIMAVKWETVKGKIQAALTSIGSGFLPYIESAVDMFMSLDESTGGMVSKLLVLGGATLALVGSFGLIKGPLEEGSKVLGGMLGKVKDLTLGRKKINIDCASNTCGSLFGGKGKGVKESLAGIGASMLSMDSATSLAPVVAAGVVAGLSTGVVVDYLHGQQQQVVQSAPAPAQQTVQNVTNNYYPQQTTQQTNLDWINPLNPHGITGQLGTLGTILGQGAGTIGSGLMGALNLGLTGGVPTLPGGNFLSGGGLYQSGSLLGSIASGGGNWLMSQFGPQPQLASWAKPIQQGLGWIQGWSQIGAGATAGEAKGILSKLNLNPLDWLKGGTASAADGKEKPSIMQDITGKGGLLDMSRFGIKIPDFKWPSVDDITKGFHLPKLPSFKWPNAGDIMKGFHLPKIPELKWPNVGSIGGWIRDKLPKVDWKIPDIGSVGGWIQDKIGWLKFPNLSWGSVAGWVQDHIGWLHFPSISWSSVAGWIQSKIPSFPWPSGPGGVITGAVRAYRSAVNRVKQAKQAASNVVSNSASTVTSTASNLLSDPIGTIAGWLGWGGPAGPGDDFDKVANTLIQPGMYQNYEGHRQNPLMSLLGGGNCFDMSLGLMQVASMMGKSNEMRWTSWNGRSHVYANIGGHDYDPARRALDFTWTPPASGPGNSNFGNRSIHLHEKAIYIEGPIYGVDDLDKKIENGLDKVVRKYGF